MTLVPDALLGEPLGLIFTVPPEGRYEAAMHALGVNAANLSEEAGHA